MRDAIDAAAPGSPNRPTVSDLQVDASGRRFRLTFLPGQALPDHRNPARLEFRIVSGSGTMDLDGDAPLALAPGMHFQLDPDRLHAVRSDGDGLVLDVRTLTISCSCC